MQSLVWDGEQSVNQPWGCTDLQVEPYWAQAGCHWHCGIDVGSLGCAGQPLYAARAGVVTALGFGYLRITPTILDGEDWYLHGIYNVAIGQAVARRERIGVFGDRAPSGGYVTGPHLHYEVQSGGWMNNPSTSRDPVPFLTAAFGPVGGTIGGADVTPAQDALLKITAYSLIGPPPPKVLAYLNVPHALDDAINLYNTSNTQDVINSFGQDGYQWMQRLAEPWLTTKGGGNINEPAEPAEPSKIALTILSVPGTATGTIS